MTYEPEEDEKGAVESQVDRGQPVEGDEVLGYSGSGREEHSGEEMSPADGWTKEKLAEIDRDAKKQNR
jgi:hypothetical protein